jgi:hypothetical protein
MSCYQVRDWDKYFENDRSRNRANCSFVCVPNKQHGMGFLRIMAEPDGASIYGIWHCIVGACSQQRVRNGWLTDGGDSAVTGWCANDLALKFRRPVDEIQRALDFLSSSKVGWLILHKSEQSHTEVTSESPQSPLKEEKEGREEKEEKASPLALAIQVFDGWNEMAERSGLPKCLVMSDQRRRKLVIRIGNEFFKSNWRQALKRVEQSSFCRGDSERGWKASLDWFMQPDSVAKLMEGKYDSVRQPNGTPTLHHLRDSIPQEVQDEI